WEGWSKLRSAAPPSSRRAGASVWERAEREFKEVKEVKEVKEFRDRREPLHSLNSLKKRWTLDVRQKRKERDECKAHKKTPSAVYLT
ncbi:MAG: hypothetical protein IKB18_06885, partial [Tidjanibacter sp.]|nr:hypothetical protein [Tidjanibacter sp.]